MGHTEIARETISPRVSTEIEKLALDLQAAFPELNAAAIERILRRTQHETALGQIGGSDENSSR